MSWEIVAGTVIVVALFAALMIPYLVKELRDGKRLAGPLRRLRRGSVTPGPATPRGAPDLNPGRVGDPAPGEPAGQPDPYGERAQRHAPPVRS
jgi:hypothetical protein